MAETSGLWTTGTSGAGHQVASYTQAQASDMLRITAACAGYEGVAPGYLSELSASATGTAVCTIAPGGAMVDGKWYNNSANVDKTIAAAVGGGNTRIDRIVVRAGWATYAATITVIAGTDAAAPGTPGLTQNSGTTYDIPLCLCTVDTSGAITITDNRTWALPQTDGTTVSTTGGNLYVPTGGINTAQIAANAVDDTKVGNRVPQIYRRQGGNATIWSTSGTTTYTPTTVRMQCGAATIGAEGANITFPEAYSYAPVVVATFADYQTRFAVVDAISTTQFAAYVFEDDGSASTGVINWISIGPE